MPSSRGSSRPRIEPKSPASPALQAGSLPTEPPGKPKSYLPTPPKYAPISTPNWSRAVCVLVTKSCPTLATPWTVARQAKSARLPCPWDFPGKNTRVDCHSLIQGIFSTQGSIPGLLHCRQTLYHLCHRGSPKWSRDWKNALLANWWDFLDSGTCARLTLSCI